MIFTVAALAEWIALGEKLIEKGAGAVASVKAAAAAHGITEDTAALDAVVVDSARRQAIAEAEAASPGTPPTPPTD